MLGDLMGKMQDMQRMMEVSKKKLETLYVDSEVENGAVKVKMNGNKKIVELSISDELLQKNDKEELEDMITVAVNRAIEKSEALYESEMQGMAGGLLSDLM